MTGYPCPACGAPANLASGCSGCGRPPYPAAAEVIRLDREIVELGAATRQARATYEGLAGRLLTAQRRRAELAAAIRTEFPTTTPAGSMAGAVPPAAVPVAVPAGPGGALPAGPGGMPPVGPGGAGSGGWPGMTPVDPAARPGGAEASTRTVQGLLFVLGGLLLGTAATVFTAVAWASVGVTGRALILLALTLLLLAVPLVARWRGLRGTAETLAAVGLLLVVLDGYAAWSVDLFGVTAWPGSLYAALVAAVSAALAAGYARLSRLTVPWFAALLAGQPVLPLAVAEARLGPAGLAVVFVGVALADLAVLVALRRPRDVAGEGATTTSAVRIAGQVTAGAGYAVALLLAAGCALVPLLVGRAGGVAVLAGVPMLLVALALLGAALLLGGAIARAVTAGALVPVLALALIRPVGELRGSVVLVAAALVVALLAGAVRLLPTGWQSGPRIGAVLVAAATATLTTLWAVVLAGATVGRSLPPWRGATAGPDYPWGWQLPVALALTAAALAWLLPRVAQPAIAVIGVAGTTLALPAAWAASWPVVVAVDLLVAVALLAVSVARPVGRATVPASALAGTVLLGHGLLVGLAGPAGAGAACAVVLVAGLGVAAVGRRGGPEQRVVAGFALLAAVLVVPAGAAIALIGAGAPPWWQSRAALAALVLPAVALVTLRTHWTDLRAYASTGFAVAAALTGLASVAVPGDEPVTLYAAGTALLVALAGFRSRPSVALTVAGVGLAAVAVLAAVPVALTALVTPYGPPPAIWAGAPAVRSVADAVPVGLALSVLALAAVLATWPTGRAGRWRLAAAVLPFVALAGPVLLVAARAPWPVVPAAALLGGVALLLVIAVRPVGAPFVAVGVPVGLVLIGAGLLNLQATRAGTLAGLGLLVVAATVAGVAARRHLVRLAGWLVAVAAATGLAITASLAAGQPLRVAAFAVLGVAAIALALAAIVPGISALTGRTLDAAAQAVALVGILLTIGAARHAATACVLWAVAVGLRLLRRGESTARRWVFAAISAGNVLLAVWLLLGAGGVTVLEAYTVPFAVLALGAGAVALRTRPGLTSWLALGPGLAAVLLPSLAAVLFGADPQPWRRLLLGAAALAATLLGAIRRWQAPVVLGGLTLAVLAVHELVRSWDLLPRWAYLGTAGLLLIALATTYERRRRDLLRLRATVSRMS
ncbi:MULTISPECIES: SCO7613 C-terminal domain-containing membrane protein [Micromonospora]|uniref:SCO7613 C-terminal domain-containing membrane protein n=1 Tax=Micromonospora TaxID=1873 RepID=UPI001EE30541|nr:MULTISPECIES: hypothetical protein [Micromonospora]WSK42373.1 hypothetical protein OG712_28640 [Micromonospora maris]